MVIEYKSCYAGRLIRLSASEVACTNKTFLAEGADGEVHRVNETIAVKLYKDMRRAAELKDKLTILCVKSSEFHDAVVAPIELVYLYDGTNEPTICGFGMKYVADADTLDRFFWSPQIPADEEDAFDQTAANLLYDLCDGLRAIHRARVVIGDLKPPNILVSKGKAYVVDFDSCSILPDYTADSFTDEYVDPRLKESGTRAKGPYPFDPESDWWALAVIAFRMFVGVSPWGGFHRDATVREMRARAHKYSVVGFDDQVKSPIGKMRPLTWFDDKPRLKAYFRNIFSPDPFARHPIDGVLEERFPRTSDTRTRHYRPPDRSIDFSPDERERYSAIFRRIEERARPQLTGDGFLDHLLKNHL